MRFAAPFLNKNSYYNTKVLINDQYTDMLPINTTDSLVNYLVFSCNSVCKGSSQLTLTIQNLQNPYFISTEPNLYLLSVEELYDIPNKYISYGSQDIYALYIQQLQLSPLVNPQIFQTNPVPG